MVERRLGKSGLCAELVQTPSDPDTWTLYIDDIPHSRVNLARPELLDFEYVRWIGHWLDESAPEGHPVTALHLGGGALTLARYLAHTRPGSRQQVIELERDLMAMVYEYLPLPRTANVRVRFGDARATLERLPQGLRGTVDCVIVDVYEGDHTPPHVTTVEFYAQLRELLAPSGIVVANVSDGQALSFARAQAATLRRVFSDVALCSEAALLSGRRFGNVVMVASQVPLPLANMARLLASDPIPARLVEGDAVTRFIAGARPSTDESARPSPSPDRGLFAARKR